MYEKDARKQESERQPRWFLNYSFRIGNIYVARLSQEYEEAGI